MTCNDFFTYHKFNPCFFNLLSDLEAFKNIENMLSGAAMSERSLVKVAALDLVSCSPFQYEYSVEDHRRKRILQVSFGDRDIDSAVGGKPGPGVVKLQKKGVCSL